MHIKVEFVFAAQVVPPRCRKPRSVTMASDIVVEVRELTAGQAPVALIARSDSQLNEHPDIAYRWFDGKLWTALATSSAEPCARTSRGTDWDYSLPTTECRKGEAWPVVRLYGDLGRNLVGASNSWAILDHYIGTNELASREDAEAAITRWAADGLLIDGVYHRVAPEPRYVVMTFGLGGNHGGTYLSVTDYNNSNIRPEAYFGATDLAAAQAYTRATAAARGDTTAVGVDPLPFLDVRLPEAFGAPSTAPKVAESALLGVHQRAAAALLTKQLRSAGTALLL
ncbi:MAG: hypothetical protein EPN31_16320 [Castellaniella sp.]|uniref:hypothetical protein n=1 Tax=Castellaniella sp. TaxID=1955812 RepID=UPI0011F45B3C|nr:hypothetical protein [Castellaniella sp.]TAN25003.1 MAG: hypothetical protein EPN31_16320 [Castellaniella sp.]